MAPPPVEFGGRNLTRISGSGAGGAFWFAALAFHLGLENQLRRGVAVSMGGDPVLFPVAEP